MNRARHQGAAFNAVVSSPWLIYPERWLQAITDIAQRAIDDPAAYAERMHAEDLAGIGMVRKSMTAGEPLPGASRHMVVIDGVAVIPVMGPIFPRANQIAFISAEATSIDHVAHDFEVALNSPGVKAILLDIDSPGGLAVGIAEFARTVAGASKPVVAYVGGLGASAAYWIASAASEIVCDRTAVLGSVGVVTTHYVQEKPDQNGYREVEIVSSHAENKRPDVGTEEGVSRVRSRLDQIEEVFISDVAVNRGLSPEEVIERFGRGDVSVGIHAVEAGMADRIASFEEVLSGLAPAPGQHETSAPATRQGQEDGLKMDPKTAPETKTAPAAVTQAAGEGNAEAAVDGAAAERARILAIQKAAFPGQEALVDKAIADGTSAGDAALAFNAEYLGRGAMKAAALAADAEVIEKVAPAASATAIAESAASAFAHLPVPERAKAEWAANADIRGEFREVRNYEGWLQLQQDAAEGKVTVSHYAPAL